MGGESSTTEKSQNQPNPQQNNSNNITEIKAPKNSDDSKRVISLEEENELEKQYNNLKTSKIIPIVYCSYINNDKTNWLVVFLGTEGGPYENGYYKVELIFKDVFPKHAPEAKFITKMFHPNINSNGHVCMDLLNYWNEKTTIENIFSGILDILDNPASENGYSNEAKKLLDKDEEEKYLETVEEYKVKYALEGF